MSPPIKPLTITLRALKIIQDNLPISKSLQTFAKFLLPYKLTSTGPENWDVEMAGGTISLSTTQVDHSLIKDLYRPHPDVL